MSDKNKPTYNKSHKPQLLNSNSLFIGDCMDYLKNFQSNKPFVDVVYLDPPYNTENKFSYKDKISKNDWKLLMTKRLSLLKNIMKEDTPVFISIDDKSLHILKKVMNNVFGEKNFLGIFITKQATRSNSKHINVIHEYVIAYAKNKSKLDRFKIKRINDPKQGKIIKEISKDIKNTYNKYGLTKAKEKLKKWIKNYQDKDNFSWFKNYNEIDEDGRVFFPKDLSVPGKPEELYIKELNLILPALNTRRWSTKNKIIKLAKNNLLHFKLNRPYEKHYLEDACDNVSSILDFYSRQGTNELKKLGLNNMFDTPKPVVLIKYLIRISTCKKDSALVLDFFAGSGTTAQAVIEINKEDNKNLSYHLVQLEEKINKDTDVYRYCMDNIIAPTIDQLTIKRINEVYKLYQLSNKLSVIILDDDGKNMLQ